MTKEVIELIRMADDDNAAELARMIANWMHVNCSDIPEENKGAFLTVAFLKALGLIVK